MLLKLPLSNFKRYFEIRMDKYILSGLKTSTSQVAQQQKIPVFDKNLDLVFMPVLASQVSILLVTRLPSGNFRATQSSGSAMDDLVIIFVKY